MSGTRPNGAELLGKNHYCDHCGKFFFAEQLREHLRWLERKKPSRRKEK